MKSPQEAEPKPFYWISLKTPPRKETPTFHDSFRHLSGRMELEIEVLSDYLDPQPLAQSVNFVQVFPDLLIAFLIGFSLLVEDGELH